MILPEFPSNRAYKELSLRTYHLVRKVGGKTLETFLEAPSKKQAVSLGRMLLGGKKVRLEKK